MVYVWFLASVTAGIVLGIASAEWKIRYRQPPPLSERQAQLAELTALSNVLLARTAWIARTMILENDCEVSPRTSYTAELAAIERAIVSIEAELDMLLSTPPGMEAGGRPDWI